MMKGLYSFLDNKIFPFVVTFFANPLVIMVTLLLLIPMIGFQNDVILILLLNSYMNVGSFGTSQITLRQVILTADQQERRAQETHDTVMQEFAKMQELIDIAAQERADIKETYASEVEEIAELKEILNLLKTGGMNNAK